MARNRYPGYCYCCGAYVPTGYGHFELRRSVPPWEPRWRIKCVKCASGRTVRPSDREVKWAEHLRDQETKESRRRRGNSDDGKGKRPITV